MGPNINLRPMNMDVMTALGLAERGSNKLVDVANEYSDRVRTTAKNKAINEILGLEATGNSQDYRNTLGNRLSQVEGIDPLAALNLIDKKVAPIVAQEQQAYQQGIDSANLVQNADKAQATATYRDKVLAGQQQDRRDTAQYRQDTLKQKEALDDVVQFKIFDENGNINEKNLENYRRFKSTDAKPLDDTTRTKNVAQTSKLMIDQMSDDEIEVYDELSPTERKKVREYYGKYGVLPSMKDKSSWYQSAKPTVDFGEDTNTTATAPETPQGKTIAEEFPDGSVIYTDGTYGMR